MCLSSGSACSHRVDPHKGRWSLHLLSPGYIGAIGAGGYRATIGPLSAHYRVRYCSGSAAIGAIGHYRGTIGPFQIVRMIRHYRTLSGTIGLSGYRVPLSGLFVVT